MLCKLFVGLAYLAGWSIQGSIDGQCGNGVLPPLKFSRKGSFQLSIFEDLHFGENAWDTWGPQQDINSIKVMNAVLDAESTDLVVLNGDLITGENTYLENSTLYVDKIVKPIIQHNLTWASTYGNHDNSYNITGATILARERLFPQSRTTQMVFGSSSGVSNYYLPVYGSDCNGCNCAPKLILWFFDSRAGWIYQQKEADGNLVGQPDWVDTSVINWFKQTNAELVQRFRGVIPSLAFVHIPTNASLAFQREVGWDPEKQPGINDDNPLAQQAQGWCEDGSNADTCTYGGQDVPFMRAVTTTPGLMALFSGHDHGDTWCYKWKGIIPGMTVRGNGLNICFGQHSGYGGYGNWIRGARQVLVTEAGLEYQEVDTWIRLEDGSVSGSISLNSTYGQDRYPATADRYTYCPTCNYSVITSMPGTKT